jgi:hypothetical protein
MITTRLDSVGWTADVHDLMGFLSSLSARLICFWGSFSRSSVKAWQSKAGRPTLPSDDAKHIYVMQLTGLAKTGIARLPLFLSSSTFPIQFASYIYVLRGCYIKTRDFQIPFDSCDVFYPNFVIPAV